MKRTYFICLFLCLTMFAIRPAQAQTETVLYNFTSGSDGASPDARLTPDGEGNFYGTTWAGNLGNGTAFELTPNGSGGWNETVIYNFCSAPNCADGRNPHSYLLMDAAGNLYGTTFEGGETNCPYSTLSTGVVYELSPVAGSWTETVLYTFPTGGADGCAPAQGLIMDHAGNLYGTTAGGGSSGYGTVFELSPSGGTWSHQVIYAPGSTTGYGIYAGIAMDSAGNIFGATTSAAFELSPDGKGGWSPTVIHTFTGSPKDGYEADGTVILDKAGNLYATTATGGAKNYGTVYKLSPVTKGKKKGTWTEKVLYSFKGGKRDGNSPIGGLVFDAAGNIYGITELGGNTNDGTVFELVAPVGKGSYKEKVLWSFNGTDGQLPPDGLVLDSTGNLYGTTYYGGSSGDGVVFEVTP